MKAGVIGLGAMGYPMAANLHRAGLLTAVWNRGTNKAQKFSAQYPVASSVDPAALAEVCDAIVVCVSADHDVLAVMDALSPALQAGAVVIDTSTVSSDTARQAAERVEAAGGRFLDAPVSGGVEGAKKASLAMMVGGEATVLETVRPVLEAMAARIQHMGPVGAGQATKAVNQIMAAGINQAVTDALAFGEAQGLPMDKVIDVVGSGAAGNWFLAHRGASMLAGQYAPGFRVALHHKDLAICQAMAAAKGVSLPTVEMTLAHYQQLMEAGFGDEDISALFREKHKMFDR